MSFAVLWKLRNKNAPLMNLTFSSVDVLPNNLRNIPNFVGVVSGASLHIYFSSHRKCGVLQSLYGSQNWSLRVIFMHSFFIVDILHLKHINSTAELNSNTIFNT